MRDDCPTNGQKLFRESLGRCSRASRREAHESQVQAAGHDNRAVLALLVLAATKLISNYTNPLAQTPNDRFMKGAEWTAPGKLKPAA